MRWNNTNVTLLHVEDDPALVRLVKTAFRRFGFRGTMISAGGVHEALDLLDGSLHTGKEISLILVDMQLPDGTGLDLLREVKSSSAWHTTPVIVLSSEAETSLVDGAYALGANCYLPKFDTGKSPLDLLRSLYECWLKDAYLPEAACRDRLQTVLATGVRLRARYADFFTDLACVFADEPEEMAFWLDRALNEGNMSNLMAFFLCRVDESDVPGETVGRVAEMQVRVRQVLATAAARLRRKPPPTPAEASRWALEFTEALDEEAVAELFGNLFPKSPAAITALRARAASQLEHLGKYALTRTEDAELRQRARAVVAWAERLAETRKVSGGEAP